MNKINFYSVEHSISLSDGSRTRYVDSLDVVKSLLYNELDKLLLEYPHVSIHVNYGEGNKPLFFDIYRHNINVLSGSDIKLD